MVIGLGDSMREIRMKETYNETIEKLKENQKCLMVRPTGFGKTYIMAHLTAEYKKVMYLYPYNVIKEDIIHKYKKVLNKNTKFCTYAKLVRDYKNHKDALLEAATKYDLIIFDEAHMAGANKTSQAVLKIMEVCDNTHFLGATATPKRMDGYDVSYELFDDSLISKYDFSDAIRDGLMNMPHYVHSTYDIVDYINGLVHKVSRLRAGKNKDDIISDIRALEIEMGRKLNGAETIKDNLDKIYPEQDYFKFIVFFSSKETLNAKKDEVEQWFSRSYPDKKIRHLIITSDAEFSKNVPNLINMKHTKNTIDLVFCINMLNMGYHIEDLTGIVMLRGTQSENIYTQQFGRCLSVNSDDTAIIFDFANNLSTKFLKELKEATRDYVAPPKSKERESRLSNINAYDLIIHDELASYKEVMDKLSTRINRLSIDEEMEQLEELYVKYSKPMKHLVRDSMLNEATIREEFKKRGVVVED